MSQRWLLALLLVGSIPVRADVGVRVLLGLMDRVGKKWDGSASIDRGKITKIDPWRFGKDDEIASDGSWKVSTAPVLSFLALVQRQTPRKDLLALSWRTCPTANSTTRSKATPRSTAFRHPGA